MTTQYDESTRPEPSDAPDVEERRNFLRSLGKWSLAVIGGVLLESALTDSNQANAGAWVNRYGGGGGWVNRYGGGGGWINRYGGGGGGWINR
jgi:hypothetical protein